MSLFNLHCTLVPHFAWFGRRCPSVVIAASLFAAAPLCAHPVNFNSTVIYSSSQPAGAAENVANWTAATFDAANIGGSGVNADGGANNGSANDATTYVANNQPRQGQTITTGSNANGYDVTSITVRVAGYTNNTATGSNGTAWNLNPMNGPLIVEIGKVSGAEVTTLTKQFFMAGTTGHPGNGQSANGPGTYITFVLPYATHLEPNTTYGFDFFIGNGGSNFFEWLGTSSDAYSGGTAYTRAWWGGPVTAVTGERAFMVNMTASTAAYAPFVHPGALHTQADFDRMAAKVAANAQPWKADFDILASSPWAQTWWPAYDVDYIMRGAVDNYTRSQQDAQAIYELALRWKVTGDTAYANKAVQIANVWSGLLGVTGDTNKSLAAGICGYLFASGGEILSTYPGWPAAEQEAFKAMMMRVFYPENLDFLWRHHDTPVTKGGNTHYRLNWDTANMASLAAIGILCDNQAVYEQALDFFKYGPGNGRVERAAWYIHPDGTAQTEESGRDQAHNLGGWYAMALLCQMAWNQGDDLFGYDNNRVLRAFEYNAKYNLGNDVPWVFHRNSSLEYTEGLWHAARGLSQYYTYELIYNHYANVKGIEAPYSKLAAAATRPEPRPDPNVHPSQVDWLGLGSLTFARDNIATGVAPSGLIGNWSKHQVMLSWWGTATATSYQIKRATDSSGPYTTVGTAGTLDLSFTDTTVIKGTSYHYIVSAVTPHGTLDSTPLLVNQGLKTHYTFEGNANDLAGARHATAMGGTTAPGYATGFGGGQAISLNGSDQYVQLPAGSGNHQDITLSAWVYWNGGAAWQRVFDFGTEIEKYMMLTVKDGSGRLNFTMTTSRGTDGTLTLVGPTMPTATWTHVAITLNGDTATLYVNGLPVVAAFGDKVEPLFSQPFCYLGRSMWNADPKFSGRIDDFRIYNYGLSGKEVYAVWGQGGANSAPAFASDPVIESSATEDINLTTSNLTLAGLASDANGGTLTFSKVTGPAWLTVATNGTLSGTPGNSDVGLNTFVVRVADSSGATDDATMRITVNNANDAPTWTTNPITKPAVSHGLVYSGTLAGLASDADGGDAITFSKVTGPPWLSVATNGAISGTPQAADAGENNFTVRATDIAGASSDATLTISVLTNSMQSRFLLDGSGGDSVGGGTATINGTANYLPGVLGQALAFDGATNYASLGSLSNLVYKDLTVAAWVYWDGGNAWQRIFDFGSGTTEYFFLTPRSGSNTLRFSIKENGVEQVVDAPMLPAGNWVHIAVTLGGETATIYVNGVAAASSSSVTNDPNNINLALNYLGKSQFAADPLFSGRIDDFRLYNYALSAGEVAALLNNVPAITPTGLVAAGGSGQIQLAWNASVTAQTYTVKRSTTDGGPYTPAANGSGLSTTTFTDTGLINGTNYYYVVSASNSLGESGNSTQSSATSNLTNLQPYAGDANTLALFHFSEVAGSSVTVNSGTLGKTAYSVNLTTASTNPPVVTTVIGGMVGYAGFGKAANTNASGSVIGWDANNNSAYNGDVSSASPSADAVGLNMLNIGNGGQSPWTMEALVQCTLSTLNVNQEIIATDSSAVSRGFQFRINSLGELQLNFVSGVSSGTADIKTLIPTTGVHAYAPNTWFHVAATYDGVNVRLYWTRANPSLTAANVISTTAAGVGTAVGAITGPVCIGNENRAAAGEYFRGSIDEVRISRVARSATDFYWQPAPSAPAGFTAISGNLQVSLNWAVSTGAAGYNVKRSSVSGGPYTVIASPTTANYVDTTVSNDTSYYYVVSAVNGAGESANSPEAAVRVGVPAAPASLVVTPGNGQAALTWSASLGATSYSVLRSSSSGGTYTVVASTITGTTYTDTGLSSGTAYYYKVIADNGSGSSAASTAASTITVPATPTAFSATAGNATVSLSWTASSGASTYNVKRATVSGGAYTTVASGVTASSYSNAGLTNGTAYYYVVSAVNSGGESANSAERSATPTPAPPSPWVSADIGAVAAAGSTSYNTGTFTIVGSGADIAGAADEFRYTYQTGSGDCQIVARVSTIQNTNSLAKSGIMVRETTATGSRHATIIVTPGGSAYFLRRTTTGGTTASTSKNNVGAPRWLKVVRAGNSFSAYYSSNGTTWTQLGTSQTITMGTTVTIGLGVSSRVDGTLCTSTLDNVTATP